MKDDIIARRKVGLAHRALDPRLVLHLHVLHHVSVLGETLQTRDTVATRPVRAACAHVTFQVLVQLAFVLEGECALRAVERHGDVLLQHHWLDEDVRANANRLLHVCGHLLVVSGSARQLLLVLLLLASSCVWLHIY